MPCIVDESAVTGFSLRIASIRLTISGQDIVCISAFSDNSESIDTRENKAAYIGYKEEIGIELVHIDKSHNFIYVSYNLYHIICAEASEKEDCTA